MEKNFLLPADILLPKENFSEWSVIACDQYTSEPEYWAESEKVVGNKPSALKIILPEAYLTDNDDVAINKINATMKEYLETDVFDCYENSMIYIERTLKNGDIRKGIFGLIDLDDYSYVKGANTPIRATEQTVIERIPPRVNIRQGAYLEMPHIMLLIDDPKNTVIEPLSVKTNDFSKLYDFELMQNAGHLKGYSINNDEISRIQNELSKLYNSSNNGLLFAVGDGNHSLASAKECYKQGKGPRYALVEVVNIHDSSLEFEPIYRVVFGVDQEKLISDFLQETGGEYFGDDAQKFTCILTDQERKISVKPTGKLCVATLQKFLDDYLAKIPNAKIDYIHGIESVKEICSREKAVGFIFNGMAKSELFTAVCADGSLPRKTFSMGCADDKRFYLEARKIK